MSNSLKNLFEVADRLLHVGAPRVRPVIKGVEIFGPLRPGMLRLTGNSRVLLQRLADRVNFSSGTAEARVGAWVSRASLAAGAMSLKTVDRALAELKKLGLVKGEARFCSSGKSANSQLSNLYTFHPDLLAACKGADKFKLVVVVPATGFAWPQAQKHGLKKTKRIDGFPFEHRCKPRQDSVSDHPLGKMTHELLVTQPPPRRRGAGLGSASREKEKEKAEPSGVRPGRLLRPGRGQARPQPCLAVPFAQCLGQDLSLDH